MYMYVIDLVITHSEVEILMFKGTEQTTSMYMHVIVMHMFALHVHVHVHTCIHVHVHVSVRYMACTCQVICTCKEEDEEVMHNVIGLRSPVVVADGSPCRHRVAVVVDQG